MCETVAPAYHRHDIPDRAWNILAPMLPGGPGKVGRPAQDNRRFINAVFRVLRTGAPCAICRWTMDTGTQLVSASIAGARKVSGRNCWKR